LRYFRAEYEHHVATGACDARGLAAAGG